MRLGRRSFVTICSIVLLFLTVDSCFAEPLSQSADVPTHAVSVSREQANRSAGVQAAAAEPGPTRNVHAEKNYFIPAVEIIGFQLVLNQINRNFASQKEDYKTDGHTIQQNFRRGWGVDRDKFSINQVGHPYQGSVYYGFSRLSGLNFWESAGYTALGSFVWEEAGETTRPSINDQITTTLGGSFLGEALVRMAKSFWYHGDADDNALETVGAAVASPPLAINRLAFGRLINSDPPNRPPVIFSELKLGLDFNENSGPDDARTSPDHTTATAAIDFTYGLPGKPGYSYDRPFDYFHFAGQLTTNKGDNIENMFVQGLIYGEKYESADSLRGIYGLYGTYDYIAPGLFRAGTSGLAFGTTSEWHMSPTLALQGSLLGGAGYGAAGSVPETNGMRSYHYGGVPEGSANLRVLVANSVAVDYSTRTYYFHGGSSDPNQSSRENVDRQAVALTVRLSGHHALGFEYDNARRSASFDQRLDQHQRVETVGIFYTYLSDAGLGRGDW